MALGLLGLSDAGWASREISMWQKFVHPYCRCGVLLVEGLGMWLVVAKPSTLNPKP